MKCARFLRTGNIAASFCRKKLDLGEELKEVIVTGSMEPLVDHLRKLEAENHALANNNGQLGVLLSQCSCHHWQLLGQARPEAVRSQGLLLSRKTDLKLLNCCEQDVH